MNAAARLVHQNVLSRHLFLSHFLNRKQMTVLLLAMSMLFSALGIVYVTHLTRVANASYEHLLSERNHLQMERGQLLLERSTWTMQSRVQQIAENKLNMAMPNHNSVVILHE
jgi:cell division protein FtsL